LPQYYYLVGDLSYLINKGEELLMSLINKVKNQYYRFPNWLLNLGASAYYKIPEKYRYGSVFTDTIEYIRKNEYSSKEEIEKLIDINFVNTVKHAYYHVPFYNKLYDEHGVDIESINGVKDICKLPFIDKDTIREHSSEMIADGTSQGEMIYVTTSGSSGNPAGFYQPDSITMEEWVYTVEIWGRIGYKPDPSRLVLRGKKLHPASGDKNFFYDPLRKELSCNIFDMRDETMAVYCSVIEQYKPEFIHGYMSAIIILAKYIERNNIVLKHQFKAILATSENVVEDQKNYVEKIFRARVFSFYGHSERLVIAGECEKCSDYHVEPLYGYCEILDKNGDEANEGEVVATGFLNNIMPLIRYKTGDIARWSADQNCSCGRFYRRIEKVIGRWHQDMLVNLNGAYVSLTALNIHSDEFDRVVRYKIVQYEKGYVDILLQVDKSFSNSDATNIKELLESKANGKIIFNVQIVEQIAILKNGKYSIIEQHIETK